MTNTSKTVLFFGTDEFSAPTLEALIAAGYTIGAVITKPDSKRGRGHKLTAPAVKQIALQHDIPVWQPVKVGDIKDDVIALGDVAGVLVSYGKIIPQSIIDLFQPGIINIHPSALPKYRGPAPIEAAISNGDDSLTISLMQLTAGMDEGPVYGYTEMDLNGKETQANLYETVGKTGAALLLQLLPSILDGSTTGLPQNDAEATYTRLLTKEDALVDPSSLTAAEIERKIRAHLVFPKTKMTIAGHLVVVTKASVASEKESELDIACKDGSYLRIEQLIGPSGRQMSGKDFLNGYAAA